MTSRAASISVDTCSSDDVCQPVCPTLGRRADRSAFHYDPVWLNVVCAALRYRPYVLTARDGDRVVGLLPLALVKSILFGRFLVSLPYVNSAGVIADSDAVATALIDQAVQLADELNVRYLELRHEREYKHPALVHQLATKVHMRLQLPSTADELWKQFKPKVRNQIRKGQQQDFTVTWGGVEMLGDFYDVFARNMRDLGTPVFGRRLFRDVLTKFGDGAEMCVVRMERRPVAAGLLVHGDRMTEVPSASSLRRYNRTNANMLLYWNLLERTIERGQAVFDFGRSSIDGNTFRFKKQWGAKPADAVWQYYVRKGDFEQMRRESGHFDRLIGLWRHLPVALTRLIGPMIVRGIP